MTTKSVIKKTKAYISQFTNFDEHDVSVAAGYSMATWLYRRYQEVKYLQIVGANGNGNTVALHAVGSICFNPIFMYGMSSQEAMLFALSNANKENGATMCLDDVAFKIVDKDGCSTTFANILNIGANSANYIYKAKEVDKEIVCEPLRPFGPKVLVRSEPFNNPAIDSKFISICMRERAYLHDHEMLSKIIKEKDEVTGAISEWAAFMNTKKRTIPSFLQLVFALSGV